MQYVQGQRIEVEMLELILKHKKINENPKHKLEMHQINTKTHGINTKPTGNTLKHPKTNMILES